MSRNPVDNFLRLLKRSPSGAVFNPWWEADRQNDIGRNAPGVRRRQLRAYLQERLGSAKIAVIGEALGYRGGHFTGIAMTSERILLGKKQDIVAAVYQRRDLHGNGGYPDKSGRQILLGIKRRRTSKPQIY